MNSLRMIFCALALLITVTAKREYKCDWSSYEYLCLVGNACIEGSRETISDSLIVFDPQTQSLKMNEIKKIADCDLFLKIRNLNGKRWLFELDYRNIQFENDKNTVKLFTKSRARGTTDILGCGLNTFWNNQYFLQEIDGENRKTVKDDLTICRFILRPDVEVPDSYENYMLPIIKQFGDFGLKYTRPDGSEKEVMFEGVKDEMLMNIARTRGCDDSLAKVVVLDRPSGESMLVNPIVIGKNADVECHQDGSHPYIKRAHEETAKRVHSVFCAGNVWAYRDKDNREDITYLGSETFELSCTRNYCKFCGKITEESCHACQKPETVVCTPKCPNDLWYFGGGVVKSALKCKPNPDYEKTGVWTAVSNGVDVPVVMGSCWTGLYPLQYVETTTSFSLVAAYWIALTLIAIVYSI